MQNKPTFPPYKKLTRTSTYVNYRLIELTIFKNQIVENEYIGINYHPLHDVLLNLTSLFSGVVFQVIFIRTHKKLDLIDGLIYMPKKRIVSFQKGTIFLRKNVISDFGLIFKPRLAAFRLFCFVLFIYLFIFYDLNRTTEGNFCRNCN